jgi:multidrug transporter EmrE-like cation transporter
MEKIIKAIHKWMDESVIDEILLVVILLATVEAIAQNTIKQSDSESLHLMFGLSAYILVGYLLHYAYHKFPLSKVNVMWSAISIVLAATFGYILYNEPMNTKSLLAVMLALGAIYFAYDA